MNTQNPILNRLTTGAGSINDSLPQAFSAQDEPLIRLARMDSMYSDYNNLYASYQNNPPDLVFNQYGSLLSYMDRSSIFYTSPFEPDSSNIEASHEDIIQDPSTSFVYSQMSVNSNSNSILAPNSKNFVSPKNAQWILNVKPDINSSGNYVFSIYFHPLQNPKLGKSDISANIGTFCNLISNADPMCFCQSGNMCINTTLGGSSNASQLQSSDPADYNTISSNCTCFSNQCQYAAKNENNQYAKSFKCTTAQTACGSSFTYSNSYGLLSDDSKPLIQKCKLGSADHQPPPANLPANNEGDSNTWKKIGISIAIVIVILVISYFLMR